MNSVTTGRPSSAGLGEEFIRSGHRPLDPDCGSCRPDYPRRCACGGLVHAQGHAHTGVAGRRNLGDVYCCDECGSAYQDEDVVEAIDADVARD